MKAEEIAAKLHVVVLQDDRCRPWGNNDEALADVAGGESVSRQFVEAQGERRARA